MFPGFPLYLPQKRGATFAAPLIAFFPNLNQDYGYKYTTFTG